MAEFQEVMRQLGRICASNYGDCDVCDLRPLCPSRTFLDKYEALGCAERLEKMVMAWAAEHSEPVYPTWGEWLESAHIVNPDPDAVCNQHLLKAWYYDSYIPADIAQKLGIEPKEEK